MRNITHEGKTNPIVTSFLTNFYESWWRIILRNPIKNRSRQKFNDNCLWKYFLNRRSNADTLKIAVCKKNVRWSLVPDRPKWWPVERVIHLSWEPFHNVMSSMSHLPRVTFCLYLKLVLKLEQVQEATLQTTFIKTLSGGQGNYLNFPRLSKQPPNLGKQYPISYKRAIIIIILLNDIIWGIMRRTLLA
jgi:hypothetical protein